ncbi:MAG: carbon-nitrogen hydrolase family protein [Pseudomonadota bacterium]
MTQSQTKIAAIQAVPVLFDKQRSAEKAAALIKEAGSNGASLAAFGETWLPGYPFWIEGGVTDLTWQASAEYIDNAIVIGGPETDLLCNAAKESNIDVVIGIAERDPLTNGSVYCTALSIGAEGKVLGRHRKLKPTHAERIIWSDGDGAGLRTYQRPYGRLSALNCWEHQMMLPGYSLVAQGTQFHCALWPGWEKTPRPEEYCWARQLVLSRAFASQAAAYVICAAGLRRSTDIPEHLRPLGDWEHAGHSAIIDPRGELIAGPLEGEGILYADASLDVIRAAKAACDIAGHYSRPDVFDVTVNRSAADSRVQFLDPDEQASTETTDNTYDTE